MFYKKVGEQGEHIIKCIGILENISLRQSVIFFEKGNIDLYRHCFLPDTFLVKPELDILKILNLYVDMVDDVLIVLDRLQLVYCDWKPHNLILCDNNIVKLCDFGSTVSMYETIKNPRKTNQLFGSPNLSCLFDKITPTKSDDHKGASYVYCALAGIQLPWYTLKLQNRPDASVYMLDEIIVLLKSFPHLFNLGTDIRHRRTWLEALDSNIC